MKTSHPGKLKIYRAGRVVSQSRNLRGIMRYTSRNWPGRHVSRVHVLETPSGALLRVRWSDGAYAVALFASCTVARRWVQARRSWPTARFTPLHYWHAPTRIECAP